MIKPISISLSPNTERDDVRLAFSALGGPAFGGKLWKDGPAVTELENEFKKYLGVKYAFGFNSGRSSLMAILNSLGLEKGSEILLQAFTCNAVPNPVLWTGLKPVFVDADEKTFNIDVEDLRRKIGPRSRAVIVQHTFGKPAEMDEVLEICRQNNLILIEDCAHSLGAAYKGKKVGTFGKVAFFSFSRDKVISSVYGGMVVTNDDGLAQKLEKYMLEIGSPTMFWIFQQLLHPVLMNWLIIPTYRILGKYLLVLFQWFHILSKAVHCKEKKGLRPAYFPKRMPNALAILALNQFKKLERFNQHRKEIAKFYAENLGSQLDEGNIYLRFPVRHPRAHEIIKKAWGNNLLIGDWYTAPIAPDYSKLEKIKYGKNFCPVSENIGYKLGSCPMAEKLAEETLNLPTHINISLKDAQKIIDFLKQWR